VRALVTGAGGMLGREVVSVLSRRGHEVVGLSHRELEVTDRDEVWRAMRRWRPDAVVHCAAMTDVDGCEIDPQRAFLVNALGTAHVAAASNAVGAKLVYISTDFVFDGEKEEGYDEFDEPRPINEYGRSKLWGERFVQSLCPRHVIVRTAWLFGFGRRNFVSAIAERLEKEGKAKAVTDQVGSPTFTRDLALAICDLLEAETFGLFHVVNSGRASRFQLARLVAEVLGLDPNVAVEPITSDQWPTPAKRPKCSALKSLRWEAEGFKPLRHFSEAIREFLSEGKMGRPLPPPGEPRKGS